MAQNTAKGNFLTSSKAFKSLCKWAFDVCDSNGTGAINETELYAGFLLVHLNLAKYAGPAACYPPTRKVVNKLFEASDDDKSGGIDETEFEHIMVILCSQIASRILIYYAILILLVPYIVSMILVTLDVIGVDDVALKVEHGMDLVVPSFLQWLLAFIPWEKMPEKIISLALFFLVIPTMFNYIDETSRSMAEQTVVYSSNETGGKAVTTASTTTAAVSGEKKDD
eukprot:CAMPEP_0202499878 /NCGR_PEP_ID=MMETSP1361-20130828/31266_1 /ASSEMBLY_ACC=CAM_ASM_000849 /TAXON_ID=210615 /ORGANISM="Staurosira complex sp., Strain CCMP2646" /LENGTH=224 /DNA_ID=CAMNT_0049132179 /DNA_START=69 /DNA_END=743 /DNA_ORIENTATION=+